MKIDPRNIDQDILDGFDAEMKDTLDAGKKGPALAESDRLLAAANAKFLPSYAQWQLTKDRKMRIDAQSGVKVALPDGKHGQSCMCHYCLPED